MKLSHEGIVRNAFTVTKRRRHAAGRAVRRFKRTPPHVGKSSPERGARTSPYRLKESRQPQLLLVAAETYQHASRSSTAGRQCAHGNLTRRHIRGLMYVRKALQSGLVRGLPNAAQDAVPNIWLFIILPASVGVVSAPPAGSGGIRRRLRNMPNTLKTCTLMEDRRAIWRLCARHGASYHQFSWRRTPIMMNIVITEMEWSGGAMMRQQSARDASRLN